jgi:TPR repeat protein
MKVSFYWRALSVPALVFLCMVRVPCLGQSAQIPPEYKKFIVQSVDQRGVIEKFLNSRGVAQKPVGRSFALVAGVTQYPRMVDVGDRTLKEAAWDIDNLVRYLKTEEFFDEIVVLKDGDVNWDNLNYFLGTHFPEQLKQEQHSRFLFAYSGHGYAVGNDPETVRGFLLESSATRLNDPVHRIDLSQLHAALGPAIDSAEKMIVLINACQSGVFLTNTHGVLPKGLSPFTPGEKGAHAIMASQTNQKSKGRVGGGSIFFEKILAGLEGPADTQGAIDSYPDGVVTFHELRDYLLEQVSNATNGDQKPVSGDLARHTSTGEFFFLNRNRKVRLPNASPADPKSLVAFGNEAVKDGVVAEPVPGDEFLQGQIAAISGNFEEAAQHLTRGAESGNVDAMNRLGYLYAEGLGVPQDYEKARLWYEKAALKGNLSSMVDLGVLYANGQGGKRDLVQALLWYRKAAAAGNAVAMHNLGLLYETGTGVEQSYTQARRWYDQCADLRYSECMKNIGIMYHLGTGVKQDYSQARAWYEKAAAAGNGAAMNNLGSFYANGEGVTQDDKQALQWYEKSATAKDAEGMFNLGFMYFKGLGVEQDYAKAREWYEKAAEAGNNRAMQNLGAIYGMGLGVPEDTAEGLRWMVKAAAAGNKEAQEFLKNLPK